MKCVKCGLERNGKKPCRPCARENERRYEAKKPDKMREKAKKRYANNPKMINEAAKLRNKVYRKVNPEKVKARDRELYQIHAETKKRAKIKYRKENPEKLKVCHEKWRKENPEAWAENQRVTSLNRRARQKKADGFHTVKDIRKLYDEQKGLCNFCGISILDGYEVDHIMPICKGGSNKPSNLQLLCQACNRRKSSFTMREFILRNC